MPALFFRGLFTGVLRRVGGFFAAHARAALLALGFLTRLGPSRMASEEELGRSVVWYPLVGLLLGGILLAGLLGADLLFGARFLFPTSPVPPARWGQPLIWGWLYAVLSAWLTRGLHLDGLADLLDALGSGRGGPEFYAVLKDSRLGAFGGMGLCCFLMGQAVLAGVSLAGHHLLPLLCAPLYGRCLPVPLARLTPPRPGPGLGNIVARASKNTAAGVAIAAGLGAAWVSLSAIGLSVCFGFTGLLLWRLRGAARAHGGWNGDFLGCAILGGELIFLLAAQC